MCCSQDTIIFGVCSVYGHIMIIVFVRSVVVSLYLINSFVIKSRVLPLSFTRNCQHSFIFTILFTTFRYFTFIFHNELMHTALFLLYFQQFSAKSFSTKHFSRKYKFFFFILWTVKLLSTFFCLHSSRIHWLYIFIALFAVWNEIFSHSLSNFFFILKL